MKPNRPLETYANRVAQFEKDQKKVGAGAERLVKSVSPADAQNPYLKARLQVLAKYPEWRRREIAEMERTGNINNAHYDSFVHDVAVLGDTFMPLC